MYVKSKRKPAGALHAMRGMGMQREREIESIERQKLGCIVRRQKLSIAMRSLAEREREKERASKRVSETDK